MSIKTMIIFIGIQASGKTSYYRQQLPGYVHISLDVLNTRNKERLAIEECIAGGTSFVIDNTNPSKDDRKRYFDMIRGKDFRVIGYYFRSSISESIERNNTRTGRANVPRKAILCTSKRLELPSYNEGFDELYYVHIENGEFITEAFINEI